MTSDPPDPLEDPTDGSAVVVRSEEQLNLSTRTVETERVRLIKRIVTEDVTITVPVSHEEVFLERTPIAADERVELAEDVELTEHTWELVLAAEQVVVTKITVPVERIRMATKVVIEEREITDTVRKEHIDLTDVEDREPAAPFHPKEN